MIIFLIVLYILVSISLYFLFPKAGVAAVKGLIPGVNFMEWCELIGRPKWWALLLLIPIVNIFIFSGMCVDMVRSFGKYGFWDSFLAVVATPISFFLTSKDEKTTYVGKTLEMEKAYAQKLMEAQQGDDKYQIKKLEANNPYTKGVGREWAEAIIFAVFAAAFIRMFLIEAYKIPTPSMEGSLLVGDFLFVSKAHYGIRMPQTIAMLPLIHNRIPFLNTESYLEKPSLKYNRLPAIESIDRNEPIVFNYPEGDSIYFDPVRTFSVHDERRNPGVAQRIQQRGLSLTTRPMDKMDHYIKRCVGIAGDSLQVINRQLYINGKPADNPSDLQFTYMVELNGMNVKKEKLDEWGIASYDIADLSQGESMKLTLSNAQVEKVKSLGTNVKVYPVKDYQVRTAGGQRAVLEKLRTYNVANSSISVNQRNQIYSVQLSDEQYQQLNGDSTVSVVPFVNPLFGNEDMSKPWTVDDFGPVWIPKKGATVKLTPQNIKQFRRVIDVYEGNDFEERNGKYIINGKEASEYTFQLDYYWMMGDNRHNSEDSRVWGFVPETHIVGKPLFIWFSTKDGNMFNGINWSRIFTSANKM